MCVFLSASGPPAQQTPTMHSGWQEGVGVGVGGSACWFQSVTAAN